MAFFTLRLLIEFVTLRPLIAFFTLRPLIAFFYSASFNCIFFTLRLLIEFVTLRTLIAFFTLHLLIAFVTLSPSIAFFTPRPLFRLPCPPSSFVQLAISRQILPDYRYLINTYSLGILLNKPIFKSRYSV
jgi:hypothetical protein